MLTISIIVPMVAPYPMSRCEERLLVERDRDELGGVARTAAGQRQRDVEAVERAARAP